MSTSLGAHASSDLSRVAARFEELVKNVTIFIRGKDEVVRAALVCVLSEGHMLVEDVPGTGKTSMAKAIAQSVDASVRRIQFTPDLLPSDVTGVSIFHSARSEFEFRKGPIFANLVLADEINRASPKTQSALLECMEERQITADGVTHEMPKPFIVMATQNPVEYAGTYPLPEAQRDRFAMRLRIGYPEEKEEIEVIENRVLRKAPEDLSAVLDTEGLQEMIATSRTAVNCSTSIIAYIRALINDTRYKQTVRLPLSPRAGVILAQTAQALAASQGRAFVSPDEVKALFIPVTAHRIVMQTEAELQGITPEDVLGEALATVRVPKEL